MANAVPKPVSGRAVPREIDRMEYWANQEVTPILRQLRANANGATPVDSRWFGIASDYPDNEANTAAIAASHDNTEALQAAIDQAVSTGLLWVHIPAGYYRVDGSLDLTQTFGLRITGEGSRTKIIGRCTGLPVFDCTGNTFCSFEGIYVKGSTLRTPSCAWLFARKAGNGSAGQHEMVRCRTTDAFTAASVVSISSEGNFYHQCRFLTTTGTAWAVAATEQNDLAVTSSYQAFPATFSGGNTVHKFSQCLFENLGASGAGGGLLATVFRDVTLSGCQLTTAGCDQAIRVEGSCADLIISGMSGEVSSSAHGLVIASGATLDTSHIAGRLDNDIYGEDTSIVRQTHFRGQFEALTAFDFYDAISCTLGETTHAVSVRNDSTGTWRFGARTDEASIAIPASPGMVWQGTRDLAGGPYYITHVADGSTLDRLQTHQIKANVPQTRVQWYKAPLSSGTITPAGRLGCVVAIELDRNVTINHPADLLSDGASNLGDEGTELTFVFKQATAPSLWTVTFDPTYFVATFVATTGANAYSAVSFKYSPWGPWIQT